MELIGNNEKKKSFCVAIILVHLIHLFKKPCLNRCRLKYFLRKKKRKKTDEMVD